MKTGTAADYIPPITSPLGRFWEQPKREDILMDDQYAIMTMETYRRLHEYNTTYPTGVYEGKMWSTFHPLHGMYLRWWAPTEDPKMCKVLFRKIIVV